MFAFACLSMFVLIGAVESPPAPEPKPAPSVREFLAKDQPPQPITVADVIKSLRLDEADVRYITEKPSGTLRMLTWRKVKLPGTEVEVDVEIQIGALSLYSFREFVLRINRRGVSKRKVEEKAITGYHRPEGNDLAGQTIRLRQGFNT